MARWPAWARSTLLHVWLGVVMVLGGCDAGRSSAPDELEDEEIIEAIDPYDEGSDEDRGAGELGPTPVERHGQLHVAEGKLRDESGEPVQLRGVSSMWLNWEDDGYAEDPTALRWMRNNWGLSVIRASMGIEPEGAYLQDPEHARAQVQTIVDNAIAAGVYVIIDWHDHEAQEHQAEAVEFFRSIAATYGDVPNVIYEPYNEPLQVSWSDVLKPYHEAVVAAIRQEDPDNVVILGTPNWSQYVHHAAADPLDGDNLMYTLHFYACTHGAQLRNLGTRALGDGAALFVTEWGATHADGGLDGEVCLEEATAWHEWMNENHVGWTAWKLDDCGRDSSCLLQPDAPLSGGWTSEYLFGHAPFVRARMQAGALTP
ncbi:glycoside hydrolase family 5 protein [Paraliomyxa miuraensis]|uniref:glycoside hydrolase family 5 protein n=1 Tax=Paraliomyxa miuraensis TaxID=376150 RepID=UPI0022554050|nr:glycoside hydrolase family 5 protein [Paraliomyxa miuraensis]MCX4240317.1 glycoside hydrolase family 5 protein [Paraliomyxa miuraensis]